MTTNKRRYRIVTIFSDDAEKLVNLMADDGWRIINVTDMPPSHYRVWFERTENRNEHENKRR